MTDTPRSDKHPITLLDSNRLFVQSVPLQLVPCKDAFLDLVVAWDIIISFLAVSVEMIDK